MTNVPSPRGKLSNGVVQHSTAGPKTCSAKTRKPAQPRLGNLLGQQSCPVACSRPEKPPRARDGTTKGLPPRGKLSKDVRPFIAAPRAGKNLLSQDSETCSAETRGPCRPRKMACSTNLIMQTRRRQNPPKLFYRELECPEQLPRNSFLAFAPVFSPRTQLTR